MTYMTYIHDDVVHTSYIHKYTTGTHTFWTYMGTHIHTYIHSYIHVYVHDIHTGYWVLKVEKLPFTLHITKPGS